jgi:hypothetical protein
MFAAYKQTLLIADQRQYIVKNIQMYFALFTSVTQIALLITFKDWHYTYYLYLIANIVFLSLNKIVAYYHYLYYTFILCFLKTKYIAFSIIFWLYVMR